MKYRKSFTTDDIPDDIENAVCLLKPNSDSPTEPHKLNLIKLLGGQWKLLEECNEFICKENTKFVLKNKPIFDAEKLKLCALENIKHKLINIGLYKTYIIEHMPFDNKCILNVNTFSNEWNKNAKQINKLVEICINDNNRFHMAHSIYCKEDKIIIPQKNNKCLCMVCIIILIVCFVFIYQYFF